MTSSPLRRKPTFLQDPLGFLEKLIAVEVPRRVAEDSIEHCVYGRMDVSVRSGNTRVRRCYDRKWGCFDDCRPLLEKAEAERILTAFSGRPMFLHIVANAEKTATQRYVQSRGANYVSVPVGGHVAVLADVSLDDENHTVPDNDRLLREVVMKARWDDLSISSTRGFLPPARKAEGADGWEAHHPSTGRGCGHVHTHRLEAAACASEIGVELDGTDDGWYVRRTTEWKAAGTVKMSTLNDLAASAERCGLRAVVNQPDDHNRYGSLTILAIEWGDERYVRWREENHYAMPATAIAWWRPPSLESDWAVDHLGRITGS